MQRPDTGRPRSISGRRHLLRIIASGLVVLLVVAGTWIGTVLYFLQRASRAEDIRLVASLVRIEELEARRNEKDFLLRALADEEFYESGASAYLDRHREHVAELRSHLRELVELLPPQSASRVVGLLALVDRYERGFHALVEACRRRGHGAHGLAGACRDAVRRLCGSFDPAERAALLPVVLDLAIAQTELVDRGEARLAGDVHRGVEAVRAAMAAHFGGAVPEGRRAPLEAVEAAVAEFTRALEEIGLTEDLGRSGELRAAVHEIEPAVQDVLAEAEAADRRAQRDLGVALAAACIIMAVLLGVALFFAQSSWLHARGLLAANRRMRDDMLARQRAERRFRVLLESAPDALVMVDTGGRILLANERTEHLFRRSRQDLEGLALVELLSSRDGRDDGDDRGERDDGAAAGSAAAAGVATGAGSRRPPFSFLTLPSGRREELELRGKRRDGDEFPVEVSASPIETDEGRVVLIAIRDITERRAVERALDEQNRRLLQSERLAAIGQMVTGLAHESRNALQRSQACLEMLLHEVQADDRAAALVQRIQDAQNRLHHLYEQVREYAAPLTLHRAPHRLDALVDAAWETLALMRRGRQVTMRQDGTEADLTCEVDAFAIEEVFRNILENALGATTDAIDIIVQWSAVTHGPAGAVSVRMRDTGPGFDAEQRRRAFEPFFTTKTRGTGLGLAISKRIVEAHGGVIAIGASAGRGGEIAIVLPRRESET